MQPKKQQDASIKQQFFGRTMLKRINGMIIYLVSKLDSKSCLQEGIRTEGIYLSFFFIAFNREFILNHERPLSQNIDMLQMP
jgi:hypothetical protein